MPAPGCSGRPFGTNASAEQLGSAAKHAPEVGRVYSRGAANIRDVMPVCPVADAVADDWTAAEAALRALATAGRAGRV